MINCLVLAGKSKDIIGSENSKAVIKINGKPMISYVINALKTSEVIGKIAVIGDIEELENTGIIGVDKIIEDRGSIIENVLAGIEYFRDDTRVLITTCDIPLLTGEAVKDFVTKSMRTQADLCYPIIDKRINEMKYPDAKRTYARLREGKYTGGNMFIVKPTIVTRCVEIAKQMIQYRKNPIKMSRVLGFRFLFKFMLGKLTIHNAEKRVAHILNIYPKAIITTYPEIGNDVDKPEDIEMAKKYLRKSAN